MLRLFILLVLPFSCNSWPDGAPCLRNVLNSMNPLEAAEHQGGLQLNDPPYKINLDVKCYMPYMDVGVTLHGINNATFKGFALQARIFMDNQKTTTEERVGQFQRDDNGSWRFQCFRFRNGITHSHHEPKNKLKMWWKTESDRGYYVQFVATVVEHRTKFWVQSILSTPLPACRKALKYENYQQSPITAPPTTNWDIFSQFGKKKTLESEQLINNNRKKPTNVSITSKRPISQVTTTKPAVVRKTGRIRTTNKSSTVSAKRPQQNQATCVNIQTQEFCRSWSGQCLFSAHVRGNCRKTCKKC